MSVIAVCGASNVDLISYVHRMPKIGETVIGTRFQKGFGGKGANQAVQAALLGSKVLMVTKLGRDSFGDETVVNYENHGINSKYVFRTSESSSGLAPITVDESGHNSIIIINGANDLLTFDEIDKIEQDLAQCKVLLTQLEIKMEITQRALQIAKKLGVLTVLNTAPAPSVPLSSDLLSLCDILCANEPEIETISGISVEDLDGAIKAAKSIVSKGAKKVLLTLGGRGCLLVDENEAKHVQATSVPQEQIVDTSGAGDSFLGALAYFLSLDFPLLEAMEKANFVASKSIQKYGTQSSYSSRNEFEGAFFEKQH